MNAPLKNDLTREVIGIAHRAMQTVELDVSFLSHQPGQKIAELYYVTELGTLCTTPDGYHVFGCYCGSQETIKANVNKKIAMGLDYLSTDMYADFLDVISNSVLKEELKTLSLIELVQSGLVKKISPIYEEDLQDE